MLTFPCNQFGAQEPGAPSEIATFCRVGYDVQFRLFGKVDVNGPSAHPLFAFLTAEKPGILGTRRVKWNFTKFLVDRSGQVRERYAPRTRPIAIERRIRDLL